ncbi:MAG: biotin--[acetyl-CoA-carboxylase] ligase [Chloroflexota bacterium]
MTSVTPSPAALDRGRPPAIGRTEHFGCVASTNDVVRDWLATGEDEICLAFADEQTAGRGRNGRTWTAPPGAGLLLSLGFRPSWLPADRVWRLAAMVSLAMADAAEDVARLPSGTVRLKWPNDLVIEREGARDDPPAVRKLGGVLGETEGLGTPDPRVVIGMGINADWPVAAFPPDLAGAMTSLRAASDDRPVDRDLLADAFVERVQGRIGALHAGRFDAATWMERQVTTGRELDLIQPDGTIVTAGGTGVDPETGALLVSQDGRERSVLVGEIRHVRLGRV